MKAAVLFDLGNTLVDYFDRSEFPAILEQAITEVQAHLRQEGLLCVSSEVMCRNVENENHEAPDFCVRPLEGRLARIFQLDPAQAARVGPEMYRRFMQPICACARRYEDTLPTLQALRARGFKTAIVSNSPWGSPADLWRAEIARLGLIEHVDAAIFCGDAGWRKPARPIFALSVQELGVAPGDCLFVGDHPIWDVAGARAFGMDAALIDRRGTMPDQPDAIHTLDALWDRL